MVKVQIYVDTLNTMQFSNHQETRTNQSYQKITLAKQKYFLKLETLGVIIKKNLIVHLIMFQRPIL